MFCPNCGAPLPDGSTFCQNCGAQLGAAQRPMQQPVQQPVYQQPVYQQPVQQVPYQYQQPQYAQQYRKPKRRGKLLKFLIVLLLIAVALYLLPRLFRKNTPPATNSGVGSSLLDLSAAAPSFDVVADDGVTYRL